MTKLKQSQNKLISFILIIYWTNFLCRTDSYYSIYILCSLIASGSFFITENIFIKYRNFSKNKFILYFASAIYSFIIILANWECFSPLKSSIFPLFLTALGGWCVAKNILIVFFYITSTLQWTTDKLKYSVSPSIIFSLSSAGIIILDLLYLFLAAYPGNLSYDSYDQYLQINTGNYSNHHPFWHTMVIKFWYDLGVSLFNTANAGVATFSIFQIICMAMCFSYTIVTLYQLLIPRKYIIICYLWFLLMPFHIAYSVTIWKDVLFAAAVACFTISLFRIMRNIGKNMSLNYIIFTISTISFGLFRTNGWLALVISFLFMIPYFYKCKKKILIICACSIVFTHILARPLMTHWNIPQSDFIVSLSIPAQQVARVIHYNCPLTQEQTQLLSQIVDIEEIAEVYTPYISDPIVKAVRTFGNQEYLVENKKEFFSLWLSLGLKYPSIYCSAWIEQTKGYWNSGYRYWIFTTGIKENNLGIERICHSEFFRDGIMKYFYTFESSDTQEVPYLLQYFVSVGLHVWLVALLMIYTLIKKKREFILTIPVLAIILTLLVATPVFCEFRYAYSIFTTLPILIFATLYNPEECSR